MSDALCILLGLVGMVALGLAAEWLNGWFDRRADRRERIRARPAQVKTRRGR